MKILLLSQHKQSMHPFISLGSNVRVKMLIIWALSLPGCSSYRWFLFLISHFVSFSSFFSWTQSWQKQIFNRLTTMLEATKCRGWPWYPAASASHAWGRQREVILQYQGRNLCSVPAEWRSLWQRDSASLTLNKKNTMIQSRRKQMTKKPTPSGHAGFITQGADNYYFKVLFLNIMFQ